MTLAETLLQKLADWRPAGEGRHAVGLSLPDHGWTVRLTADRVDTLSCALTEVEAERATPLPDDDKLLEAHARRAAGRVTGLLEPVRLIEIDRVRHIALVRSDSPPEKDGSVHFYEITFCGRNRVKVERFKAAKQSPAKRESIRFVLTHEVLAKLVDDLVRD
jgi:hypothetical protein